MMYWSLQGIGRNALADVTTKVMAEIGRTNGSHISTLMSRFRDDVTRHEMDSVLQSLATMGYCMHILNTGEIKITGGYPNARRWNGEVAHDSKNRNRREELSSDNNTKESDDNYGSRD
jgi:hypothetical protein